jgi:hypothetical protein
MTTYSLTRGRFYKTVVIALSIALVCSLIPPEGWGLLFGVGTAQAAPAATGLASVLPGGVDSPVTEALQNALPSDLAKQLTGMNALGPDGQPNGMLMDAGAVQAKIQRKPASMVEPISISRVQSAYRAAKATSDTLAGRRRA